MAQSDDVKSEINSSYDNPDQVAFPPMCKILYKLQF